MERLRVALEEHGCRPRGSGQRFRAVCPSHESHGSLTLAAAQGQRGAVLWCHAGCPQAEILAVLGLDWSALFDHDRERTPDWRPRPRPAADPMAVLRRVFTRAVGIINLRAAMDAYTEACPMPSPTADERIELAEWGEKRDQDAHYWRFMARTAALACDEQYVRQAYTGQLAGRLTHAQAVVLITRAEDLAGARTEAAA